MWIGIPVPVASAALGLPILATTGGIALFPFRNAGLPVASVPVETHRLVASPVLLSLPWFRLAGCLLVEGGAGDPRPAIRRPSYPSFLRENGRA